MYVDGDAAVREFRDRAGLDARINFGPLTLPVRTNRLMSPQSPTFPRVGPVNVLGRGREHSIGIPGVECGVESSELLSGVHV
jgi:hypothetical protein